MAGIGDKGVDLRSALRPHLGKLLPRILRARHDPNKQTREQMASLWNGLTGGGGAESRQIITEHLLPTIDSLIEDAKSKLWRARVGACGALSEILIGREWDSLGGGGPVLTDEDDEREKASAGVRLLRLWRVTMRSLDDVRGAVRESGETLARTIRALTVRLCDPTGASKGSGSKRGREEMHRETKNATSAAATSLRWLIQHGLKQPCAEATGLCLSTLVEVVGVVSPKILEPSLPELIRSLLLAMSGLEPAALNFLQLRTENQESLERIRLQMCQSGPIADALLKCTSMLPSTSLETQKAVVVQLDTALRMSVGFATRAAVADTTSSLCSTCPGGFRFAGSSSSNPSVRLLRAFYYASEREQGKAAKDRMIHALGSLASLCPGSSVRSLARRACLRYTTSSGNNEDPGARKASAAAIRAIAVRASEHFADGGASDEWRRHILPVSFLGRKDPDEAVASLWSEVWDEGGSVSRLAGDNRGDGFGTCLEEILLPHLVKECVRALRDVAWSRRIAGAHALSDLSKKGILAPVPRSTRNQFITENTMSRAEVRADATLVLLIECVVILRKPRIWTGKSEVLKATVDMASQWVSAEAAEDADDSVLYGWRDTEGCTRKPIEMQNLGDSNNDLLKGDGWFGRDQQLQSEVEEKQDSRPTEDTDDDTSPDVPLDFKNCDEVVSEVEGTSDVEMDDAETKLPLQFIGLCRLLISQATLQVRSSSDDLLPYRIEALRGFQTLLHSLPSNEASENIKRHIYSRMSGTFRQLIVPENTDGGAVAPVITAGAIKSLSSCFWAGMGSDFDVDTIELIEMLKSVGGSGQPAWTIREASVLGVGKIIELCCFKDLRKHKVISLAVDCAQRGLQDRRFWKVRYVRIEKHTMVSNGVPTNLVLFSDTRV